MFVKIEIISSIFSDHNAVRLDISYWGERSYKKHKHMETKQHTSELWMEVHDIVQETEIKTIPPKKQSKKANWLSEEALQITVKRREAKSKG